MRKAQPLLLFLSALLVGTAQGAVDKSGVKPQVVSLPSGPGSIEGLGESFEPRLNTGAAGYSVSLDVPPGVNGHAPELTLHYSSGAGNGHFGIGWRLDLPYIQRQTDKGQPSYGEEDLFVYSNGEELVPLADGTWRCENESSFLRFRRIEDGWEVTDRGGRIYRMGQYPDEGDPIRGSRVGRNDASFDETFRWYPTSFEDTNGNRIEYFYTAYSDSPGELFLTEVRYNISGEAYNAVSVDYELRPDAIADYRSGFRIRTGRRGARIRILSRGSLVREYRLDYEPAQSEILDPTAPGALVFALSLLTKITQLDNRGNGVNHLPPMRLGYTRLHTRDRDNAPVGNFPGAEDVDLNGNGVEDGNGLQVMGDAPINLNFHGGNVDFLDVNGDALPDVVHTDTLAHYYYPNLDGKRFGPQETMANRPGVYLASTGASLADLDGDGLADLVNKPTADRLYGYRNRGDGSWGTGVEYASPMFADLTDPDVRLLDIDFDKRIDLVRSISGSHWQVCRHALEADVDLPPFENFPGPEDLDHDGNGIRNGGAWSCSGSLPVPFLPPVRFSNPGVHLADMNGDRLQDVVWLRQLSGDETAVWYWPSMGGGRFDQYAVMSGQVSTGPVDIANLRVADVTGNGLSDLLKVQSGLVTAWINLGGDRWSEPVTFGAPAYDSSTTTIRVADMNGNGSADLVWIKTVGNVAERWQYLDFIPVAKPNQLKIVDNGIGRRIVIGYRSSTSYRIEAEGDGNPWQIHSPVSTQVVSRVSVSTGLDLDGTPGTDTYLTDYAYRDAFYDSREKAFRGFAFVKKIERGDVHSPTGVTRLFFHTGAPDGIDNDGDGRIDERTILGGAEEEPLKGRLLAQEAATADGGANTSIGDGEETPDEAVFSRTRDDWSVRRLHSPTGGSRGIASLDEREVSFAFSKRQDVSFIELGGGPSATTRKTFDYDDFGNRIAESDFGEIDATGDELITLTDYVLNTQRWIVDKPKHRLQTDDAGNRVAENYYYYDGPPYVGLPQGQVERGNLTRGQAWVEGETFIDGTRNAFDTHGNIVGILDPNGTVGGDGHRVEIAYDTVFTAYPIGETIHVGGGSLPLTATADYDLGLGVITESRDFNGHVTRYHYDSFGRLVSIVRPGDTAALPTASFAYVPADPVRGLRYEYTPDGTLTLTSAPAAANSVTTRIREESGETGTLDDWKYLDGMGRTLAEVKEDEDGFIVSAAVLFNARAAPREAFQPYRSTTPDYAPPSNLTGATEGSTLMHYDASGRETARINPTETFEPDAPRTQVATRYLPLAKTVTDEERNEKTFREDGLGRLVEVQEINSGETYTTRYTYNPLDGLTLVTDAQGNRKRFAYDGLQRKIFMNDPDRGVMTWLYDSASNVLESLDAKGQRTTFDYDGTNRLLAEDYHDEGEPFSANRSPDIAYHYDVPKGIVDPGDNTSETATNTKGRLAWVEDLTGEEHTSYDERGRESWVLKRVGDPFTEVLTPFTTRMTYDALDRLRELVYPDNDRVTHAYNARGLLDRITGGPSGAIVSNLDYRPSGQKALCEYGNGVVTSYGYDPRLRLTSLRTHPAASPEDPLIDYAYGLDGASNILRIDDLRPGSVVPPGNPGRNTQIFTYDDLYRLTGVRYSFALPGQPDRDDGGIDYAYDRIGNMLAKTSDLLHLENGFSVTNPGQMSYGGPAGSFDRDGRPPDGPPGPHALTLADDGSTRRHYAYDDNGNMLNIDDLQLSWDFKDRLIIAENAAMRAEYAYDYTDRRIIKRVEPKEGDDTTATVYVNRWFEVREHDQPVKYVFDGDTRAARVTGTLDPTAERVQRFRIYPGWNLIGLAVDVIDAAAQLGPGSNAAIEEAYWWDAETDTFFPLTEGETLAAGTVAWIKAVTPASLPVRGAYTQPSFSEVPSGGSFFTLPGIQALQLSTNLPPELDSIWSFDAKKQQWRGFHNGDAAFLSDAPEAAAAGSSLFLIAPVAIEIAAATSSNRITYYQQDHLRSSNLVADSTGTPAAVTVFYPYGQPRSIYSAGGSGGASYLFAQKERDKESGLQYFSARYTTPPLGRFLSPDPICGQVDNNGLDFSSNGTAPICSYSYADNNPVNLADPSGLASRAALSLLSQASSDLASRRGVSDWKAYAAAAIATPLYPGLSGAVQEYSYQLLGNMSWNLNDQLIISKYATFEKYFQTMDRTELSNSDEIKEIDYSRIGQAAVEDMFLSAFLLGAGKGVKEEAKSAFKGIIGGALKRLNQADATTTYAPTNSTSGRKVSSPKWQALPHPDASNTKSLVAPPTSSGLSQQNVQPSQLPEISQ